MEWQRFINGFHSESFYCPSYSLATHSLFFLLPTFPQGPYLLCLLAKQKKAPPKTAPFLVWQIRKKTQSTVCISAPSYKDEIYNHLQQPTSPSVPQRQKPRRKARVCAESRCLPVKTGPPCIAERPWAEKELGPKSNSPALPPWEPPHIRFHRV